MEFLSKLKGYPLLKLKRLVLGARDKICVNNYKCRGILQISFILLL